MSECIIFYLLRICIIFFWQFYTIIDQFCLYLKGNEWKCLKILEIYIFFVTVYCSITFIYSRTFNKAKCIWIHNRTRYEHFPPMIHTRTHQMRVTLTVSIHPCGSRLYFKQKRWQRRKNQSHSCNGAHRTSRMSEKNVYKFVEHFNKVASYFLGFVVFDVFVAPMNLGKNDSKKTHTLNQFVLLLLRNILVLFICRMNLKLVLLLRIRLQPSKMYIKIYTIQRLPWHCLPYFFRSLFPFCRQESKKLQLLINKQARKVLECAWQREKQNRIMSRKYTYQRG